MCSVETEKDTIMKLYYDQKGQDENRLTKECSRRVLQ